MAQLLEGTAAVPHAVAPPADLHGVLLLLQGPAIPALVRAHVLLHAFFSVVGLLFYSIKNKKTKNKKRFPDRRIRVTLNNPPAGLKSGFLKVRRKTLDGRTH